MTGASGKLGKRFHPRRLIPLLALLCLASVAPAAAQDSATEFDHDRTVFPLDFKHALAPCESCHVQGVFAGTPRRCRDCHTQSGRIKATAPPSGHIRIIEDCDACHRPDLWRNVFRVDHAAIVGSCTSCHNGFHAMGKSARHVLSSNLCEDCHVTFSWSAARYNHDSIAGSCASCHNGATAEGKNARHIASAATCEDCHNSRAWEPVKRVDHASVFGACFSCHNGATAEGKNPGHIASAETCGDCHVTRAWEPVNRVDHGSVFGTCFSCHNGVTAEGKHAQHVPSGNDCSSCHNTFGWLPATP